MPPVAVYDLQVHPRDNDLVIATHGRGLWILDDIAPLQQLLDARRTDLTVFEPKPATRTLLWRRDASLGQRTYLAPNPPEGVSISYYTAVAPTGPVTATITNKAGEAIRTISLSKARAGINRFVWDLRYDAARAASADMGRQMSSYGYNPSGYRGGDGPAVVPGDYTVTLNVASKTAKVVVHVRMDPRVQVAPADLASQVDALLTLRDLTTKSNLMVDGTESLLEQLGKALAAVRQAGGAGASGGQESSNAASRGLSELLDAAQTRAREVRGKLTRPIPGILYREGPKLREEILASAADLNGAAAAPNQAQLVRIKELSAESARAIAEFNQIATTIVARINERLGGQPRIVVSPVVP